MAMLGSQCSVCCSGTACGCKAGTKLPYTMTVTLSGLHNKTKGNYCDLLISSDVGGGASGVATSPGGCDGDTDPICGKTGQDGSGKCGGTTTSAPSNRGPLTGVLLTASGSGYVSLRSQPTVTAGGGSGTGAKFDVTLKQDKCDWSVKSVSVTGGKDYVEGDSLSFTIADGDTQKTPAQATLHTQRAEPTLTASAPGGVGAALTVTYTPTERTPSTWSISGITVASGGTGYHGGDSVTFTLGKSDTEVSAASATITTSRVEPTLSASVSGTGSGASLTVSLTPNSEGTSWSVSAIGITDGGTGYSEWDYVTVNVVDGQTEGWPSFYAYVSSVDENGAITSVAIYYNYGSYFKEGGVIQSVALSDGGSYYKDTGVPDTVDVTNGGKYYRDDPNGEPCAAVTVTPCGGGTGAKISATVDATAGSPDYGKITGLTIDNGGTGYLAWHWINTCNENLNGVPFVLKADTPEPLISLSFESCYGTGAKASVIPFGNRTQPDVCLIGSGIGGTISPTLKSDVEDGNEWLKYWSLDSVSASGGYRYANNESATIDYRGATVSESAQVTLQATGTTVEDPPNVKNDGVLTGATVVSAGKSYVQHAYDGTAGPIKLVKLESGGSGYAIFGREQPTLTIQPSEGSLGAGATFTPTFSKHQDSCGVHYWTVESVSVSGGTCFGAVGRTAPTLTASAEGGSGATFSVQTETAKDGCGGTYWKVSKITPSLGVGYTDGSPVTITAPANVTVKTAAVASLVTDGPGAPTSVVISEPGHYFIKGPDESLSVTPATSNDKEQQKAVFTVKANDAGVPTSVTVANKGSYYRENKSLTPYVASVTVQIGQILPSDGSEAVITPIIETNTNSSKFGQITKLTIDNGGSGYQLLGGPLDCRYSGPCGLALQFRGAGREAEVTLQDAVFRTADKLEDCTKLPSSASVFHSIGEGSVAIAPGGAWDDKVVCPCKDGSCTPKDSAACDQSADPYGGTPCGQQSIPCPPCVGYCDNCNKCARGCGCSGSKCVPCCGPCSEANPCPNGCMCVDGSCEEPCKCSFRNNYGTVFTATATVTVTLPGGDPNLGHCKGGEYSGTFVLWPMYGYLFGTKNVDTGDGRTLCLMCYLFCDGVDYSSQAVFATYPCNTIYWQCYWSCYPDQYGGNGGGFVGAGTTGYTHDTEYVAKQDGTRACIPKSGGGSYGGGVESQYQCASIDYSIEINKQ